MLVAKNTRLLAWFNFCLDFRLYDAVAAVYFSQITGSYTLGLTIFAIGTLSSALFEVPTGILSDFVGRKKTLVVGALSSTISILLYALGDSFLVLALGAVIGGLSQSLFSGNNEALLYDSMKSEGREEEFSAALGKTSSMFQLALAISALLGSLVLGFESLKWVFWLSVIPQIIGLFISFWLIEPPNSHEKETNLFRHLRDSWQVISTNYKLRTLSFAKILDRGLGEAVHQFYPTFIATLWPVWAIGLARVGSHVFAALGMRIAGIFVKKYGELKTLLLSSLPGYLVGVGVIVAPTVATPFINSLLSLPSGVGWVAQGGLLHREFTDKQRSTLASLNSLVASLLFAILALVVGLAADHYGIQMALLGLYALTGINIYLYWKLFKNHALTSNP